MSKDPHEVKEETTLLQKRLAFPAEGMERTKAQEAAKTPESLSAHLLVTVV